MTSFNLLDCPWITCAPLNGVTREFGLVELFERSHELRGLANESPLIDAAVFRLLLAVLHRCFGPKNKDAWFALLRQGTLPMEPLRAYLGEWRDRFDLFHKETPFYQAPKLVEQSSNYSRGKKPAREMIAEQSSYGAPRELFESRPDESLPIAAAAAARWLVSLQAFHTGGLLTRDVANGDPTSVQAGPLCGSAVVTVQGDTLFDALLLNLLPYPANGIFPTASDDAPAWEQVPLTKFRRRACRGWLDWLTWQSRRIQLFGDAEKGVTEFILLGGNQLQAENPPRDPMCAYKKNDKDGWLPIRFSQDRALWRDSTALLHVQSDELYHGPAVLSELTRRQLDSARSLMLQIYGQMPNKASIVLTRTETVPLPTELLSRQDLIGLIDEQLSKAEEVQRALRDALFSALQAILGPGERTPDPKDVISLRDNTQVIPRYWSEVKPLFDRFLAEVVTDEANAVEQFRAGLRTAAISGYERSVSQVSRASRTLKGFTVGRGRLLTELTKVGLGRTANTQTQTNLAEAAK